MVLGDRVEDQDVPRALTLSTSEDRFVETAFSLSSPRRAAVLMELMQAVDALTVTEIAQRTGTPSEDLERHLEALTAAGLVEEKRKGVMRRRVYRTLLSDVEIRFFGADKPEGAKERTNRIVEKGARELTRRKRKLERREAQIERKRARLEKSE